MYADILSPKGKATNAILNHLTKTLHLTLAQAIYPTCSLLTINIIYIATYCHGKQNAKEI